MADHLKSHQFSPGRSGNPGGKPSFVKACEAAGIDPKKLRADLIAKAVAALEKLDPATASFRFILQLLFHYAHGKPKDHIDMNVTGISEEQLAHLEALAMTPHERRRRIAELRASEADGDGDEDDHPEEAEPNRDDLDDADE